MLTNIVKSIKIHFLKKKLKEFHIHNYIINDDGTINVDGDINLAAKKLTKIPFKFHIVTGDFYCHCNKLISLKGCPVEVGRNFDCSNNGLKNLIGGPYDVGRDYNCNENQLDSLDGLAIEIGRDLKCGANSLRNLDTISNINGSVYCGLNNLNLKDDGFNGWCGGEIHYNYVKFY